MLDPKWVFHRANGALCHTLPHIMVWWTARKVPHKLVYTHGRVRWHERIPVSQHMPLHLPRRANQCPCPQEFLLADDFVPHTLSLVFSHGHVHADRDLRGHMAAHAEDAFMAAANRAKSHGADSEYILTNATAFPKCIYILSMLFTHMFNKSLSII